MRRALWGTSLRACLLASLLGSVLTASMGAAQTPAAAPRSAPLREPAPTLPLIGDGTTLDLRWTTAFAAPAAASPAFDADSAFVPLKDGQLVAVDLDDGTLRWQVAVRTSLQPAVGGGRVYVVRGSSVVALDAQSGAVDWEVPLDHDVVSPPYWDTGWMLVSTRDGALVALRASDGAVVWRQAFGVPLACPPAPALDRLFVALTDGRVASLQLATGIVDWVRPLEAPATGLAALDDQLIVGSTAKTVYSLDLRRGTTRWRWRLGAGVAGAPVADDYRVYVVSRDHLMRAFDRDTGNLRWMTPLAVRPSARGPVLIGRNLFVPSYATSLPAYLAETGKAAFSLTLPGEATGGAELRAGGALLAARVVTLTLEGQLAAFGARVEPPPVPLGALPGAPVLEPPPVRPARGTARPGPAPN